VGVVDTNFQSPSLHIMFGLTSTKINRSINDYLWGQCQIEQAVYPLSSLAGALFFVPASPDASSINKILRQGYADELLIAGFDELIATLKLDFLLLDLNAGLHEETLFTLNFSDILINILHPTQQDYQGIGVLTEIVRQLKVPYIMMVVNEVPSILDWEILKSQIIKNYECQEVVLFPHTEEIQAMASRGIFVERYPHHPATQIFQQITEKIRN